MSLWPLRAARCSGVLSLPFPSKRATTMLLLNNSWVTCKKELRNSEKVIRIQRTFSQKALQFCLLGSKQVQFKVQENNQPGCQPRHMTLYSLALRIYQMEFSFQLGQNPPAAQQLTRCCAAKLDSFHQPNSLQHLHSRIPNDQSERLNRNCSPWRIEFEVN